ncbi:hypothetical protein HFP15_00175 [Amycolatopsis sp. K13G38]|uniref:PduH protein n=1 Tax=Amycolatopsis acididurans TaxID=2724524 RepID=A0ABX1IYW3_9PSEU|nr:glycerol dehydratase reactivase beta/small subunit family protein [Amycolatopsis acididurans]NKQ51295.1 hypothetical protein [Amycolatopsis acididurans]
MPVTDRRADRARHAPPSVVVRCARSSGLREVRAGMEEEGVPLRVEDGDGSAAELAFAAARASSLGVGIGLDATTVCVHHAKRPPDSPVLTAALAHARVCGHNAARLVVGLPLKAFPEKEEMWPDN